jgi:[ribosomal protein S5]-alanine N-acetyltransferase
MTRLETDRLTLTPITAELVDALLHDRAAAEELVGATIPQGFPDAELGGYLPVYAERVREDPAQLGFGPWVAISREESAVVLSGGFLGKPGEERSIELGYGTDPGFRNRGFATEAALALAEWGLAQPGVERVVSRCDPANEPSARVLEKAGFVRTGEADGMLLWEYRPPV